MAHKPILFSAPMINALLAGRKTQTRRIIKGVRRDNCMIVKPATKTRSIVITHVIGAPSFGLLPFQVGDYLWVRETWAEYTMFGNSSLFGEQEADLIAYRADGENKQVTKWTPSIFMPREHSRLTLEVTHVRVELLQKLTREDAISEGISALPLQDPKDPSAWWQSAPGQHQARTPEASFKKLWDSLNSKRGFGWEQNPWVAAYTFKVHHSNIKNFTQQEAA